MRHIALSLSLVCLAASPAVSGETTSNAYVIPSDAKFPDGNTIRANGDYYSVYAEAICINHEESWFKKNLIAVTTKLTVNGKNIDVSIFSGLARESCRIATAHSLLISSVPTAAPDLKLGIEIRRFDKKDFMVRVLNFVNGSKDDPLLKSYATAYVPYIALAGQVGNKLYETFGPEAAGSILMSFLNTTLSSNSPAGDRFQLRDTYVVLYSGERSFEEQKLKFDNGELTYEGKPVRDGAWAVFRIERSRIRTDLAGREWHAKFETAIRELAKPKPNNEVIRKDFDDASVLLDADQDFTDTDKTRILRTYRESLEKARVFNTSGSSESVEKAIGGALVFPNYSESNTVNFLDPTTIPDVTFYPRVGKLWDPFMTKNFLNKSTEPSIDPSKLLHNLEKLLPK